MSVAGMIGIALVAALFAVMLRRSHGEYALLLSIGGGVILLLSILSQAMPAFEQINQWLSAAGITGETTGILLKTLGICFLTQFAADWRKAAGQGALASKVEMAGKVTVVVLALPLFQSIASTAVSLIGGG